MRNTNLLKRAREVNCTWSSHCLKGFLSKTDPILVGESPVMTLGHSADATVVAQQLFDSDLRQARQRAAVGILTIPFEFTYLNRGRRIQMVRCTHRCCMRWQSFRSSPRQGKPVTWRREAVQVVCGQGSRLDVVKTNERR